MSDHLGRRIRELIDDAKQRGRSDRGIVCVYVRDLEAALESEAVRK